MKCPEPDCNGKLYFRPEMTPKILCTACSVIWTRTTYPGGR